MKILLIYLSMLVIGLGLMAENYNYNKSYTKNKEKHLFIPPPKNVKIMALGYEDSIADSLWIRWVIDPDVCGRQRILRSEFEKQDIFRKENRGRFDNALHFNRNLKKVCNESWSFLLLDGISKLAPHWREPYFRGSLFLSVIVDDHYGAKVMFDRALINFPNDWKLHYQAAYHYLNELEDFSKAAELLKRAGTLGAPLWVSSLASRLYSSMGQTFLAYTTLKSYIETQIDENAEIDNEYVLKLKKRLTKLEAQLNEARQKSSNKSAQ